MEFTLKINKLSDINIIKNADTYLLTNRNLSLRYGFSLDLSKVSNVVERLHSNNKKVGFLVNKIFFDSDMVMLKESLMTLIKANVDYIYFADFAVFQIMKDLKSEDKCVFFHETFIKSNEDLKAYQELGFKNIVVSKDMNLDSIKMIDNKNCVGIIAFSYMPLYFSKRAVIKNFCKLNKLKVKDDNKSLYIKEEKRDEFYRILEQNHIATIFAPLPLNYLSYIDILKDHVSNLIFDSLFIDAKTMKRIINAFKGKGNIDDVPSTSLFLTKKDWEIS